MIDFKGECCWWLGARWVGVGDFEVVRYCLRLAAEVLPIDIINNLNIIKPVK
jgi:hypothetical protein